MKFLFLNIFEIEINHLHNFLEMNREIKIVDHLLKDSVYKFFMALYDELQIFFEKNFKFIENWYISISNSIFYSIFFIVLKNIEFYYKLKKLSSIFSKALFQI